MYIHSTSTSYHDYNYNKVPSFIKCPPYSKILSVKIHRGNIDIIYQCESYVDVYNISKDAKIFNFIVLSGFYHNNVSISDNYQYYQTVKSFEDDRVEYYHIFIEEIKSIAESRNNKIEQIVTDQEF